VFVPRVDFVTASGSPDRVVTPLAVLGFDRTAARLVLDSYHPGQSVESVRAATGFELPSRFDVGETPEPTADEIRILRNEAHQRLAAVYPGDVDRIRP